MTFCLIRAQALCQAPERKIKLAAVLAHEACPLRKAIRTYQVEGHSGVNQKGLPEGGML